MKAPHPLKRRLAAIAAFLGIILLLFSLVLYDTQVIHGSEYKAQSMASNATSQVVEASHRHSLWRTSPTTHLWWHLR